MSKAPGVARAIRGMPRPEEEREVERVEQQVDDPQVHETHVSQHNYQFNMMVGIDPARLDEVIREGRAMLEESMNRTAHAEQVAIDVHREACNRIQQLTEAVEKLQHAGMTLESQLLSERESHSQAIIAYDAECNALAHKNEACKATIQRLEMHCSNLEASLAAFRAAAEKHSPTSLPPVQQQSEPALPLAPIMDAIQMLSQRLEAVETSSPNGAGRNVLGSDNEDEEEELIEDKRRAEKELVDGRAMHQAHIESVPSNASEFRRWKNTLILMMGRLDVSFVSGCGCWRVTACRGDHRALTSPRAPRDRR